MAQNVKRRLYGRGLTRSNGDYRIKVGGRLKVEEGRSVVRNRLANRLLSSPNGWYHRPGKGVGLRDFLGRPLTRQAKREIFNRLDLLLEDPSVDEIREKKVTSKTDSANRSYLLVEFSAVTRDGELRFTDVDAFEVR